MNYQKIADILNKDILEYFRHKNVQFWMDFMDYLSGNLDFNMYVHFEMIHVKSLFDIIKMIYKELYQSDITYFDIIKCASGMNGEPDYYLTPGFDKATLDEVDHEISKYLIDYKEFE